MIPHYYHYVLSILFNKQKMSELDKKQDFSIDNYNKFVKFAKDVFGFTTHAAYIYLLQFNHRNWGLGISR